jgi:CBS domain-containing protein
MKVKDVMTRDVVTVGPETSLKEVAEILAERRISGMPVVRADGEVLGVVSEGDILFKERGASQRKGTLSWLKDPYGMEGLLKLEARTAGEAMTAPARTIAPWRALSAAAALMLEQHVNRLPVVDDGELVGIVTRADLVRAFIRPDDEIEHEIRQGVLREALWLDSPERVTVAVEDGVVTLGGTVDARTDAELVATFAAKVPGVVGVDSSIGWLEDNGRVR